jgi:signal transduction histidine kinase
MEERIDERTRIARELHDTLLQSFQALAMILQAARNQFARRPAEALKMLDDAIDQASMAVAEGRETIQGMRSSGSNTGELAAAIRAAGESYVSEGSPTFRVTVDGTARGVNPIISGEVYRIACEAIRNAFLHAEAKVIEGEIRFGDELRLHIRDDGKGIDRAILEEGRVGHYGLAGMRERAARIGGTLRVWSAPGAGSEIELIVPGSISFDTSARQPSRRVFRRKHKTAAE